MSCAISPRFALICCLTLLGLAGCAHQKPVLYSANGQHTAGDQAVDACIARARSAGLSYKRGSNVGRNAVENGAVGGAGGAVAGAIYGNAARGAAAGAAGGVAAGLVRGLFHHDGKPSPAYRNYVNRCLRDQGYDPVGWN